jgi:hypothetical protein
MTLTRRTTMRDVAFTAGVSQQTVSRVLRTPDAVAAATRTRVAEVIADLGYVPNEAAQRLQSTRFERAPAPLPVSDVSYRKTASMNGDLSYRQATEVLESLHTLARAWGVPNIGSTTRRSMSESLAVVKEQLSAHDLEGPRALLALHGQLAHASRDVALAHLEEHLRVQVEAIRPHEPDAYDWPALVALAGDLIAAMEEAGT